MLPHATLPAATVRKLTVEYVVDQHPHVETIQVVMEDSLLRRADAFPLGCDG
jgi:hypothetical protein